MSLRVQLPLNGNTNNQGVDGITLSGSPASYSAGKIGTAATQNGSVGNVVYNNTTAYNYTDNFSFALWVYPIYTGSTAQYAFTVGRADAGGYGYGLQVASATQVSARFGNKVITVTCNSNAWSHIAMTVANSTINVYVNGALASSQAIGSLPTYSDGNGMGLGCFHYSGNIYPYYGRINDFRIYDHALSAKEVKEISKGLVVHYPLNGNQSGLDNILINTADLSKQTKESGITCTYDSNKGIYKIEDTSHTSSRQGIYQDISVNPNTFYTLSCTLEGESCGIGFGFFNGTPTNFPSNVINVTSSDGQVRKTYSAQSTSTATYCRIYLFTNCGTSKIAYFKFPKLELGSIATPWIPNSTDTEYSAYGYNSLTELDISGYKNHGTKTKIMNIDVDTPRYNVCTIFDGTNDCILTPFNSVIKDNNYTISVWVKKSVIGTDYYQTIFGGPSGFELEARNGQTNEAKFVTQNQGKVSYTYNFNQWYHFVFVHSSSDSKLYIDGTLIGTGSTASIPSGNYYVGSWRDTTSQNFEGQMSDFRIYATALSADDVKELYSSSASIANNGTVMCYEFNEE